MDEIIKQIKKESKFSIAYILDILEVNSMYTLYLEIYKKKELQDKLIELIKDEKNLNRLLKLQTYKKFKNEEG